MKVCFPINTNEGMESIPYNHFGSAKMFIVVDSETREVKTIDNGNLDHEHGKCQPIKALCGEVVDAIVVLGIGQGAIVKLNSMGIKVYQAVEGSIGDNIDSLNKGELKEFDSNYTCNHDGCSHHNHYKIFLNEIVS